MANILAIAIHVEFDDVVDIVAAIALEDLVTRVLQREVLENSSAVSDSSS